MPSVRKKLWGHEVWHHNDIHYCMKTLVINQGFQSSLHAHKRKRETFLVVDGEVQLEYAGRVVCLTVGESFDIERGVFHRFRSLSATSTVVEASTFHEESDVIRREESRRIE